MYKSDTNADKGVGGQKNRKFCWLHIWKLPKADPSNMFSRFPLPCPNRIWGTAPSCRMDTESPTICSLPTSYSVSPPSSQNTAPTPGTTQTLPYLINGQLSHVLYTFQAIVHGYSSKLGRNQRTLCMSTADRCKGAGAEIHLRRYLCVVAER